MMRNKKLQKIIGVVLTCLTVLTVYFAIRASSSGQKLITLEDKALKLQQENQELNSQILDSTSLSQVGKLATAMGMDKPQKFVYMNGTGVAMR
jgi:cell division protein FtsL